MRALSCKPIKGITIGSLLTCDDNSGARLVRVIGVIGYKGRHGRWPRAGLGDVVRVSVKRGTPQMVKKIERAVITRQCAPIRRAKGRIAFEDNACVLIDETGLPKGTEIKGAVAREVGERFPRIVAIARIVV